MRAPRHPLRCLPALLLLLSTAAASRSARLTSNAAPAETRKPQPAPLVASPCDADADCNAPHGKCVASARTTSASSPPLKLCMCSAPWYGPDCTRVEKQAACDPPCSNGGFCTVTATSAVCVCRPGFVGATCDGRGCPNKCTNHGICKVTTDPASGKSTGKCFCNPGFAGHACDRRVCPYTQRGECDGAGRCIRGECKCRAGFFGKACSKRRCVSKCSGHGVCTNATFACECDPGFVGATCERAVCPKTKEGTCGGHGSCDHTTGACTCDAEYAGVSCSYKKCNGGKVGCSGHGRCEAAKCVCDVGYVGVACESHGCPMNCLHQAGHGECINGECQCFPGYSGAGCGTKMVVPQPCGDQCQTRCQAADAHACAVEVPELGRAKAGEGLVATGGAFPGAKCYQKCLWGCVRGCFSQLSPAAARAEAEHWNTTVADLGQWKREAMKQYAALEGEASGSKAGSSIDSSGLEKKVEKLRDIMEYVDALKAAAGKEKARSQRLATVGDRAEERADVA
jgi:hypothetical protein